MTDKDSPNQAGNTLYDVARVAKVSPTSVSRVINGNKRVGDAIRERVLAAIEELKYEVNVAARVARGGSLRIGLLYSNSSTAFLTHLLVGATDRCSLNGAQLLLQTCAGQDGWREAVDRLIADKVSGILLTPPLCDYAPLLDLLAGLDMPTVAVATASPTRSTATVRIDDYEGALSMMQHLIALGHRDIAFIQGDPSHTPALQRYRAYLEAMKAASIEVRAEWIAEGMFTYRSGIAAARYLLGLSRRPSAIFACNDDMAAAVVAVAHGLQLDVPDDLAVCGFDDTPLATTLWPSLTTVHQPLREMGQVAVDLVFEQIRRQRKGLAAYVEHKLLPYRLMERQSSSLHGLATA